MFYLLIVTLASSSYKTCVAETTASYHFSSRPLFSLSKHRHLVFYLGNTTFSWQKNKGIISTAVIRFTCRPDWGRWNSLTWLLFFNHNYDLFKYTYLKKMYIYLKQAEHKLPFFSPWSKTGAVEVKNPLWEDILPVTPLTTPPPPLPLPSLSHCVS